MVYRFRSGRDIPGLTADVVGETLRQMADANGGRVTPVQVVEESRDEDAPLHAAFEWDDATAAEGYREEQARRLLRSYVIVTVDEDGEEQEEIPFVSVATNFDREGPAYMAPRPAMEDPDLRERIVRLARAQLKGWRNRYAHLTELAQVVEAIDAALEARPEPVAPAPPPPPERPPARRRPRPDERPGPRLAAGAP